MYMTKLALSVGRTILRPKVETEIAIQDRSPTLFFLDLLKHYDETLPPTIAKKKRDSERPVPTKKRTAPIDVRMSRSRLSAQGLDPKQVYQQQITHSRNPSRTRADSAAALPPIPGTPPTPVPPPPPPPVRAASPQDPNAPPPRPMHFAEPVDDDDGQELTISPPTPQPNSPPVPAEQETSPTSAASPASPAPEDRPIAGAGAAAAGGTGLSRTGSGGVMRGPRPATGARPAPAKGPRAAPGTPTSALARPAHSRVGSSVSTGRSASPTVDPHEYDPKGKKVGRVAAGTFSRRTVASDTEEEVLNQ